MWREIIGDDQMIASLDLTHEPSTSSSKLLVIMGTRPRLSLAATRKPLPPERESHPEEYLRALKDC